MSEMLYRRGETWWYKFVFAGRIFRESAKTNSKELARRAEMKRRRDLEEGYHGLKKRQAPQTLKSASDDWLELKKPTLAPKSYLIEKTNLGHILPVLGQKLLTDLDAADISRYQQHRLKEKAAPKTINLEIGTIRAVLRRRHRLWANLQPDVRMLSTSDDIGKALSPEDEKNLLDECAESRSRSLFPAVLLALNTGMRYSEVRLLRWKQADLERLTVRVGKSKTEARAGRVIPLNDRAAILTFWAEQFPKREPEHFVFASEKYGAGGDRFEPTVYNVDPTKAINSWKEAWEAAKQRADVTIRFHDLRHTCVTRMLEGGAPLSVVASILG